MNRKRVESSFALLQEITDAARLSSSGAEPIRLAENDLWKLPGGIVVRIARSGQDEAAAREVAVARWLHESSVPAVRPLEMSQPIRVGGRSATFWEQLPPHRHGSVADLAPLLRMMHSLHIPSFPIGRLDPFVRLVERLQGARSIGTADREWLLQRLRRLRREWDSLPDGLPQCVIHGDAWDGNCAVTDDGPLLLDFERTSVGPPEWDLTSTAVAFDTFGSLSREMYQDYCTSYGFDVMAWSGYSTLRDIRELRLVTFALQIGDQDVKAMHQARHRIDCVRGRCGPRPWRWEAVG
ncbi:aminoglycoside phosphotransferase family protein [Streptomyces sp. NBC_00820]|uniref:phosphotransferase n=1 Tax=Streptomyces sp. NBC_00820 TaxID=2975842 RepID=UPI002ECFF8A3|nr:aminoglycoside phosphotransferase family protein [Streptomyces sp. NBC_00820]